MKHTHTMDMTKGVIWKEIIIFAMPLLAGNIFQQLYSTVDSIVVGNFVGVYALGAISSVSPAINTLIGFFAGLSTGASVLISHQFGAASKEGLTKAIHTSILMTFLIGIALTGIGIWASPGLLRLMQTPPEVLKDAVTYMQIYFAGILTLTFYNMGAGILRAVGDSRHPLQFLIITSILNIILDLLFVVVFKMGVAGVAYATIIAQLISDILLAILLFRTEECYKVSLKHMKIDRPSAKEIMTIGIPAGLQMAITAFSNVFVQSYINQFGAACTAGWGTYNRLDSFLMLPRQSIGTSITTFVGQNAGAGEKQRIHAGIRTAMLISIGFNTVISAVLFIFAPQAVSLFNKDAGVICYGTLFLRLLTPISILSCFTQIFAGVLRGVGNAKTPMLIMLGSFVVFRQIYLFIVSRFSDSIIAIAFGYPAGWIVCAIAMFIYYKKANWEGHIGIRPLTK